MKKSFKVILVMIIIMIASINVAMAATGNAQVNMTLTPSANTVKLGETFTVVLSQECSDGLISVDSKLEYNANIFELTNIEMGNGWTNYGDGNVITAMSDEDRTSGDVFTLTFKALAESKGSITIKNIEAYKDYNDIVNVPEKSVEITVGDGQAEVPATLTSISVTKGATKTQYTAGEKFDVSGMKITATYSDGTSKEVTNFTYSPNGDLKTSDKKVTVSYTEGGVTKTAEQAITVKAVQNQEPANNTANNVSNNVVSNNTVKNTTNNTAKNTTLISAATNNTTNDVSATQKSTLPKTGSAAMYIILAAIVFGGIAVISYKKYREI